MTNPTPPIDLAELRSLAETAPSESGGYWVPHPTGMDRDEMRSFTFVRSHNHTPFIPTLVADYIHAFRPSTVLALLDRIDAAEEALEYYAQYEGNTHAREALSKAKGGV